MNSNWWSKRRVLVTGGAGFIGSNLVRRLLREGAQVRVVDNLERGRLEYLGEALPGVEFRSEDLRSPEVCRRACQEIDVIFHLASKVGGIRYYVDYPGEVFGENTLIDHNLWSAALAQNVPLYFYASSAHVYPGHLQQSPDAPLIREEQAYPAAPELSYGWAKLAGEQLIQYSIKQGDCGTRAAIARIIGAYGPNQSLDLATGSCIPVFCRRAIEYPSDGPFRILGTGEETRSYHFITDTVEALLRAVRKCEESPLVGPFNLGAEDRVTIRDLALSIVGLSGKKIDLAFETNHPTFIWGQALDCSLAGRLLDGWRPQVSLHDGLSACYEDIRRRLEGARGEAAKA